VSRDITDGAAHDVCIDDHGLAAIDILLHAGRVVEAAELVELAFLEGTLSGTTGAQLRLKLASALLLNGQAAEALGHAEVILAESGLDDEIYRAAQLSRLLALMAHDEFAATREPAVAILAATPSAREDESLAGALTTMGSLAWTEGRVSDSILLLGAAVTRARRGRFADRAMHPRQSLAALLAAIGEFDEAEALLTEDLADIRLGDDRGWAVGVAVRRSRLHLGAGRIAQAVADANAALALAEEMGAGLFVPLAQTTLALAALHKGDLEAAMAHLERCVAEAPSSKGGFASFLGAWIQARVSYAADGPGVAVKSLAGVFDNLPANKRLLLEEPAVAAWMVRTALAAGDQRRAAAVADAAAQLATTNGEFPSVVAIASHARGLVDKDAAALLAAFSDHGHPWTRASAAEDASAVLVAEGQTMPGRNLLGSAIALYEHAGADHDAQRARRRLRQLRPPTGPRTARRGASDWSSLTEAERRVAALVAQGVTNDQIGERMYLSRPTVDFHLRQIFGKLALETREQLVRLTRQHPPSGRDE
jgi:DNA-binding CsgD family transcriptional regulator